MTERFQMNYDALESAVVNDGKFGDVDRSCFFPVDPMLDDMYVSEDTVLNEPGNIKSTFATRYSAASESQVGTELDFMCIYDPSSSYIEMFRQWERISEDAAFANGAKFRYIAGPKFFESVTDADIITIERTAREVGVDLDTLANGEHLSQDAMFRLLELNRHPKVRLFLGSERLIHFTGV